jgi:hypothetical protein
MRRDASNWTPTSRSPLCRSGIGERDGIALQPSPGSRGDVTGGRSPEDLRGVTTDSVSLDGRGLTDDNFVTSPSP